MANLHLLLYKSCILWIIDYYGDYKNYGHPMLPVSKAILDRDWSRRFKQLTLLLKLPRKGTWPAQAKALV